MLSPPPPGLVVTAAQSAGAVGAAVDGRGLGTGDPEDAYASGAASTHAVVTEDTDDSRRCSWPPGFCNLGTYTRGNTLLGRKRGALTRAPVGGASVAGSGTPAWEAPPPDAHLGGPSLVVEEGP